MGHPVDIQIIFLFTLHRMYEDVIHEVDEVSYDLHDVGPGDDVEVEYYVFGKTQVLLFGS